MEVREARCFCGALAVTCRGEPVRVSICHCLACKQRSGSAFSYNAIYPLERVEMHGPSAVYSRISDEGNVARFHFCAACGSTLWYEIEARPGMASIPVGAFADPSFPEPRFSVWEERQHDWLRIETSAPIERQF